MTRPLSQSDTRYRLEIITSPAHPCAYLPELEATTAFIEPAAELSNEHYSRLTELGYRRSGPYIYKPACRTCNSCIPVRVPVTEYRPSRRERRINARNRELSVHDVAPDYHDEHFALYRSYISTRHPDAGMDTPDPEPYRSFIDSKWGETRLVEFRSAKRLLAVAVTDRLLNGLSAVYTFFDPEEYRRSLGIYSILWQIREAHRLGLDWLYLGYWIKESRKMRYKGDFQPLQAYLDGHWTDLPTMEE